MVKNTIDFSDFYTVHKKEKPVKKKPGIIKRLISKVDKPHRIKFGKKKLPLSKSSGLHGGGLGVSAQSGMRGFLR